jgi:hypothetical protein
MNNQLSDREKGYKDRLVDVCREIIEEYELTKMSDDVYEVDDDWGFYITVDEYVEGTNEDNNNNSANDEAQDYNVFGENKI